MTSKYTAFRCPEDLLQKAKLRAKLEHRSLSNYLVMLIDRDVANLGDNITILEAEANAEDRTEATEPHQARGSTIL